MIQGKFVQGCYLKSMLKNYTDNFQNFWHKNVKWLANLH